METDLALCGLPSCTKPMPADEAIWDFEADEAYCCREHRAEHQENKKARAWKFEDELYASVGIEL